MYVSLFYTGKPLENGPYYIQSVHDVTMELVDLYARSNDILGRNLVTDNLYTSIPLARSLLQRQVTLVGSMSANRKGIPKQILETKDRAENSTVILHEKDCKKMKQRRKCGKMPAA